MKGKLRRQEILKRLYDSDSPVTANSLANEFCVSRQIIVKDIALLRAEGYSISSCSRGYICTEGMIHERVFKIIHSDDDVEKELNLIVDCGGTVIDVFVFHKFYNKVKAGMYIRTHSDIDAFLKNIKNGKSSLLKNITSGYHYHTVSAINEEILDLIESKLKEENFLAPLQEYEPSGITGI